MNTHLLLMVPLGLVLVAGCGRKKDWDEEVVVRVFKPKGVDVGTVTVTATQEGKTEKVTVDGFSDCDANRVRVIPKQGSNSTLTLTAAASAGGLSPVTRSIKPPTQQVDLVLGTSAALEPAGSCIPSILDSGPPKKAIGEPCTGGDQCQGGACVTQMRNMSTVITFTGGYCSQDCSASGTPCNTTTEQCLDSIDGTGTTEAQYCIKKCLKTGDCPRGGYECKISSDLCMPL